MTTMKTDWKEYRKRVEAMEAEGLTTSDAQAAVDAEMMQEDKAYDLGFLHGLQEGIEDNPFEDDMKRHFYRIGYDAGVSEYCRREGA